MDTTKSVVYFKLLRLFTLCENSYVVLSLQDLTGWPTWVYLDLVEQFVHLNVPISIQFSAATLGETLVRHRKKQHLYIGCMKSGPVLAQK